MLISLLVFLLVSNAVNIRRDKSILFSRIVIIGLFLTNLLAYNNFWFNGGLFDMLNLIQLLIIAIMTLISLCYLIIYCEAHLPILLGYLSTIICLIVINLHKPIFSYVCVSLELQYFYLIPLLLIQILLATYLSVKNKCNLPSVISLSFLVLFTVILYLLVILFLPLLSPLFLPLCMGLPIVGSFLQDVKLTAFLNEENISNYNFLSDKNWKLSEGKTIYRRKLAILEEHYTKFINNGLPTNSKTYLSQYITLHKARLDFIQTSKWLIYHSNGLGLKNLPRQIGAQEHIPALKAEVAVPKYSDSLDEVDRRFR